MLDMNKFLLEELSNREHTVIMLRCGLEGKPLTLREIGEKFGVSRGRIHQIEAKALRKLRHPNQTGKLIAHINDLATLPECSPEYRLLCSIFQMPFREIIEKYQGGENGNQNNDLP